MSLSKKKFIAIIDISKLIIYISREKLREILQLLRNTSNPQVEYITKIMKKWAKDNKVAIVD